MIYASGRESLKTVQLLNDRGANIYQKNKYGRTALIETEKSGPCKIIKLLLEKKVDVNARKNAGRGRQTALIEAAFLERDDVVRLLIEKKPI